MASEVMPSPYEEGVTRCGASGAGRTSRRTPCRRAKTRNDER